MNRKLFTPKIFIFLCFLVSSFSVKATIIPVTLGADTGIGSLRDVVANASAGDTITFNSLLDGLPIILFSEIAIDKSLTIMGNGAANTVFDGNLGSRVFTISNEAQVTISAVTMTRGSASDSGGAMSVSGNATVVVEACVISNNTASGDNANQGGGGIYNNANLTLQNGTIVMNNTAGGTSGSGGGILNDVGGSLTVSDCMISGNSASRAGGGIEDVSGDVTTVTITNVTITNNNTGSAPGNGGGIHITGAGSMMITGGAVSGNTASAEGGGLWNGAGTMTVSGVTIDGNKASGNGADQGGGGIYNLSGTLVVESGTMITNNSCDGTSGSGGGVLIDAGASAAFAGSTISGNSASRAGGGIEDNSGDASVINVINMMITNNSTGSAPGNGGGVHITGGGNMRVVGGAVSGNTAAAEGGGLWNGSGEMIVNGVTIDDNKASGADANQGGGGLYNLSGSLIIENSTMITNNTCDGASGSGGGILNDVGATLTISDCTISGNTANRAGGGIEDVSGSTTSSSLTNVTLNGNDAGTSPGNGGGIHITGDGNMTINGGTMLENTAVEGGALWNGSGDMSTGGIEVGSNTAIRGGGIFNNGGIFTLNFGTVYDNKTEISGRNSGNGDGAGIYNISGGNVTLNGATISGNTSIANGGGIYNEGTFNIVTSTVANNTAAVNGGGVAQAGSDALVSVNSSIIAENTAALGQDVYLAAGTSTSGGYNLIGINDATSFSEVATDLVGSTSTMINTMLGDLADNGGDVQTQALLCGSAAIDAGNPTIATADARRQAVFGTQRDIGAYEKQESCESEMVPEINVVNPQFDADFLITARLSGGNEVPAVTTDAVGVASIHFNEDRTKATVNATVSNLSSAFTGVHIHEGSPGTNGPVLIGLTESYDNGRVTAEFDVDKALLARLVNGELYFNLHTENNPGGELRGNLALEAAESFVGYFSGDQENPALDVPGTGLATVHYTANTNVLEVNVLVDGLTGPITGAHFHRGAVGENGPVVEGLTDFVTGVGIKVKLQASEGYIEDLRAGNIYLNIHTEANPSGEIRAQVNAVDGFVIDTWCNAEQETADLFVVGLDNSLALGYFNMNASLDSLDYYVQISELTAFTTAAHLHEAALAEGGPVVLNMTDDITENLIVGTGIPIEPSLANTILSGDNYLNIHTAINPDGEVRGQLYRVARDGYYYDLCTEQEIPTPTGAENVSGSGMFAFNRDMDEAHLMVVVNELTSDFMGAHIHNAGLGETGGVIFPFTDNFMNGGAFLYFTGDSETPFNTDFASIIRSSQVYVNIHTANNPAGEVRGQILKELGCPISTSTLEVGQAVVNFEVFPNPATDQLNLILSEIDAATLNQLEVAIFNNVGQQVKRMSAAQANQIDISDLDAGMYYLTLSADGVMSGIKFIKE